MYDVIYYYSTLRTLSRLTYAYGVGCVAGTDATRVVLSACCTDCFRRGHPRPPTGTTTVTNGLQYTPNDMTKITVLKCVKICVYDDIITKTMYIHNMDIELGMDFADIRLSLMAYELTDTCYDVSAIGFPDVVLAGFHGAT